MTRVSRLLVQASLGGPGTDIPHPNCPAQGSRVPSEGWVELFPTQAQGSGSRARPKLQATLAAELHRGLTEGPRCTEAGALEGGPGFGPRVAQKKWKGGAKAQTTGRLGPSLSGAASPRSPFLSCKAPVPDAQCAAGRELQVCNHGEERSADIVKEGVFPAASAESPAVSLRARRTASFSVGRAKGTSVLASGTRVGFLAGTELPRGCCWRPLGCPQPQGLRTHDTANSRWKVLGSYGS